MSADLPAIYSKAFERWGWKCVPVIVVCWVVLWPVIALMLMTGLLMLSVAIRGTPALRQAG